MESGRRPISYNLDESNELMFDKHDSDLVQVYGGSLRQSDSYEASMSMTDTDPHRTERLA